MAFSIALASALLHLGPTLRHSGHLVTISRYNVWFDYAQALRLFELLNIAPAYQPLPDQIITRDNGTLMGSIFFRMLGFSQVTEIEHPSTCEDGCVPLDLNQGETPAQLIDCADAVFDFGTSEHVFNTPNLLAHMGRILKPGGFVLHHTPANNQVNHGFYQFSPTLYFDYYQANAYDSEIYLLNHFEQPHDIKQQFSPLSSDDCWREMKTGEQKVMNLFSARKTAVSTIGRAPVQAIYTNRLA
ncbi:MAG: class I SAM-dependent methyltransferase [Magnetospirillum sp.]|nr:class I SAM-dependent methyltransferase [Magnetospirillum sp.]